MPLNPDAVGTVSEAAEATWSSKDSLLYALGVGAGQTDPTGFELEFTTENSEGDRPEGPADDAGRHQRTIAQGCRRPSRRSGRSTGRCSCTASRA